MPRPSSSSSSSPDAPTVRIPAPTGEQTVAVETTAKPDLTLSKVVAAGGAAATSAVLGSYLGAAGTVSGAAIGAVASTVAAVVYQRSIDRTRVTVLSRVRPVVPSPRPVPAEESDRTVVLRPEPPRRSRRLRAVLLGVLAFVLALGAITGVEWARGETLTTGETGTSVGRVVAPQPAAEEEAPAGEDATDGSTGDTTTDPGAGATDGTTPSPESGSAEEEPLPGPGEDAGSDDGATTGDAPADGVEPTGTPEG